MKREYKKPELVTEDFVLSEYVASNCNLDLDVFTFGSGMAGCSEPVDVDPNIKLDWATGVFTDVCDWDYQYEENYCYHSQTGSFVTFTS